MKPTETKRYIGRLNKMNEDSDYGFIYHSIIGEVFYHPNNQNKQFRGASITEDDILIFELRESKKYAGKFSANNIYLLKRETNLSFLIFSINEILFSGLSKSFTIYEHIIIEEIVKQIKILFQNKPNENIYDTFISGLKKDESQAQISSSSYRISFCQIALEIGRKLFSNHFNEISIFVKKYIENNELNELTKKGYLIGNEIDYVSNRILNNNKIDFSKEFIDLTIQEKRQCVFKIILEFENINSESKENKIKELLDLYQEHFPENREEILNEILKICPPYTKLSLWLSGHYENLNFEESKLFILTLKPDDQIKFVKKLIYYIKIGKINLVLSDILALNVFSYEEAKELEKSYPVKIDYSTSVALKIISELSLNATFDTFKIENTIYQTVLNIVKNPTDIPEMKGYFDKCLGRCRISYTESEDENKQKVISNIEYYRNEKAIPDFHTYCDGRKAIERTTGKPSLSTKAKVEFWWCGNEPCYRPSRDIHNDDWENYSIQDFLKILNIQFHEKDYEILLGLINKANTFFKHLKCQYCEQILHPESESNYAYHRINRFICVNSECSQNKTVVYLNHCLNGRCKNIIDSRKSSKCRPAGFDYEKCGWYVCDYCLSCCSSEQIGKSVIRRQSINPNYTYKCHTEGHRELGKICCYNCGHEMHENKIRSEEYNKTLQWFIDKQTGHKHIGKSGQNPKWWFLFLKADLTMEAFYERIEKLKNMGFRIPYADVKKDYQLIAEGQPLELSCTNELCGTFINLNENPQRLSAIKGFHNVFIGTKFEVPDDLH